MPNTSIVGEKKTDTIMEYILLGILDTNNYPSEINEFAIDCCIPWDSDQNPYYTITPQEMALEDQIESILSFSSSEGLSEEIQEILSSQKGLPKEDLKPKIHELFEIFLLSEELEKARELLQLAVNFFPDEKSFIIAKNIIAPPKVVSSNKSEMEGILETIEFFRNMGKKFNKMWVAVSKGRLLEVSDSYSILAETYKDKNVFIAKVL